MVADTHLKYRYHGDTNYDGQMDEWTKGVGSPLWNRRSAKCYPLMETVEPKAFASEVEHRTLPLEDSMPFESTAQW
jgi:hypothetical protein